MAQITKELASKLTNELLTKKKEAVKKAKQELSDLVRKEHMKSVPKELRELFDKYPNSFKSTSLVALIGSGFNFQNVHFDDAPSTHGKYSYNMEVKNASIKPKYDKWEKMTKDLRHSEEVIYNTILSLRTYAKIAEAFPEIADKLEVKKVESLVNIVEVRKLIK